MTNQFKVTPEQARIEWLADLKSDKFPKGKGFLNKDCKLCCLGVAVESFKRVEGREPEINSKCYEEETLDKYPSVRKWLGLFTGAGDYYSQHRYDDLARLNDDTDTFSEVIKVIESNSAGLFVTTGVVNEN